MLREPFQSSESVGAGALRGMLDTVPSAILLFSPDGMPRMVNRHARELLGDLASTPLSRWLPRVLRADGTPSDDVGLPPLATLRDAQARRDVEISLVRPDGVAVPVLVSCSAVVDPEGRVLQVSCAFTSIAKLRQREESTRRQARRDAIGAVAHSLAGPFNDALTAIAGYCELAIGRLDRSDPVCQVVAEIQQAGERARLLTARLLAHGEREVPQPQVLDLDRWLGRHLTTVRGLVGDHIQVEARPDARDCRVRVDPVLLEQIVSDLVTNARDAMAAGGRLRITTQEVEIDPDLAPLLGAERAGTYGVLTVQDSGRGLDERNLQRIFEPFYTTKQGALGLGLTTVERLVRAHGGFVRVEIRRHEGASFHVYLPTTEEPAELTASPEQPAPVFSRRARILLVEDDAVVRDLVHEVLAMQHLEVVDAHTADDAMAALQRLSGGLDLLISDVVLPGDGGDVLARRLRVDHPDLPVILMSGCSDAERIESALGLKAISFLPKPFSPDALLRRVRGILLA